MIKVVFVPAPFKVIPSVKPQPSTMNNFLRRFIPAPVEEDSEDTFSDSEIDGAALAILVEKAMNDLLELGFNIDQVTPITSGRYDYMLEANNKFVGKSAAAGLGFGYSYTEGMLISASMDNNKV